MVCLSSDQSLSHRLSFGARVHSGMDCIALWFVAILPSRKALLVRSHYLSHSWELSCRLILGVYGLSFLYTQVHVEVEGGEVD